MNATVSSKKKLMDRGSTKGKKLLDIPRKAKIQILSWGKWCRVSYNGVEGYLQKSSFKLSAYKVPPAGVSIQPGNEFTVTGKTVLRKTGKSSGKKLANLPAGARVILEAAGKTWNRVRYGSFTGFVESKYLQLVIPSLCSYQYSNPTRKRRFDREYKLHAGWPGFKA